MKSKARRTIERWVAGAVRNPIYLADGSVFMAPANSDGTQHIVARLVRRTPKKAYVEWVCSCRGFWFSATDECPHVRGLREAWEAKEAS